jgi:hypothetical protein
MGLKEIFKIVLLLAALLAATWFVAPFFFAPKCTTDIVTTSAALKRSYDDLDAAKDAGKPVLSSPHRRA